jgi:hypothetical protein
MSKALKEYESHNDNNFIIFYTKYLCFIDFIFASNSLIKYNWRLKIKKAFFNDKYILHE